MAAAGEEEGWHGSDGFEVFRLHHATHAMKPIHIEIQKFQSLRKRNVVLVLSLLVLKAQNLKPVSLSDSDPGSRIPGTERSEA